MLGRFGAVAAVVKVTRPPLPTDDVQQLLCDVALAARAPYSGMEYGYHVGSSPTYGKLSVDVLCPAAIPDAALTAEQRAALLEKHVTRFTAQPAHLVRETAALYAAAHAPLVASLPTAALGWVYKILSHEKEVERLLHDTPGEDGFLLNVDPKWASHPPMAAGEDRSSWRDHPSVRDLYVLGLCHRRDVASLRDLRAKHLPMLRAMRDVGLATIERTYGVPADKVKCFVHYPPQFYHFHVHFTGLGVAIGGGCNVERAHLLDDIIEALERDTEHYARCSLTIRVGEKDELLSRIKESANAA